MANANFTKNTNWTATISPNLDTNKTVTISTNGKYVDRDIVVTLGSAQSTTGDATLQTTATAHGEFSTPTVTNLTYSETENLSGCKLGMSANLTADATALTTMGYIGNEHESDSDTATVTKSVYINGATLGNSKTFTLTDPIYSWTWETDASGNVLVY